MFKTLFCHVFLLFFFCCSLIGRTNDNFEEDILSGSPIVFEMVLTHQNALACAIPTEICDESPRVCSPIYGGVHPVTLTPDEQETYGLRFLPFGIKLDPGNGMIVPLFMHFTPRLMNNGEWRMMGNWSQPNWSLWHSSGYNESLNVRAPGISDQMAQIEFLEPAQGQYTLIIRISLSNAAVFEHASFSTYDYCDDSVMACSSYNFPNNTSNPCQQSSGNVQLGLQSAEANGPTTISVATDDNFSSEDNSLNYSQSSTIGSLENWTVRNPFHEAIDVYLPQILSQPAELMLYSIDGKQIRQLQVSPGDSHYQLMTGDLPSGTYFLRMIVGDEVQSKMIIKG